MKYFDENMSVDDARKKMFSLSAEMREDKTASDKMWAEYEKVRPILYEKEASDPNVTNMLTS
jgi:hypothetical protein